jgi:hypothetical protein
MTFYVYVLCVFFGCYVGLVIVSFLNLDHIFQGSSNAFHIGWVFYCDKLRFLDQKQVVKRRKN